MLALGRRELTLMKRNFVVYKAKTIQVAVMGLVTATLFLRTHIHPISPNDGQEIAGFLYFATLIMLFNGIAELTMTVYYFCQSSDSLLLLPGCCRLCCTAICTSRTVGVLPVFMQICLAPVRKLGHPLSCHSYMGPSLCQSPLALYLTSLRTDPVPTPPAPPKQLTVNARCQACCL